MDTAFDIAKRISFQKQKSYTRFIVRLSIAATAISVAAILLTFSIVNGFQESIANKVYSFWGHIRVASINGDPINRNKSTEAILLENSAVKSITPFLTQSAVLSYKQDIEGIAAKGMPNNTHLPFLTAGRGIRTNADSLITEIVISDEIAKRLDVQIGAMIRLYFLNSGAVQQRKLKLVGLYHSGIQDYDQHFVFVDLKLIQQLNNHPNEIEAYSISIAEKEDKNIINKSIQDILPPNTVATPIEDYYPQIFDWIGVQTINRNVTITIMLLIAIVNLLTCLFILMLERIPMISTLTALGASHQLLRKIFLYQASFISWMGISIGCIVGLGLSILQQKYGWIQLDESAYFIKVLPIKIIPMQVLLVVLGTAVVSYLSFLIPTLWIKKIRPAQAIRFD